MKTRIVHTRIWQDSWFINLPISSRFVFLYILTCESNNLCGIFELPDRNILFDTGLTKQQLEKAKQDLEGKIIFYNGWVKVINVDKYNNYSGSKNEIAIKRELLFVPKELKGKKIDRVSIGYSSMTNSSINHKSEIINKKSETIRGKHLPKKNEVSVKEMITIAETYRVPLKFVLSKWDDVLNYCHANDKRYTDFSRVLCSFVKKDAGNNRITQSLPIPKSIKQVSAEERARVQKKMDQLRKENPLLIKKIPPVQG